MKTKTHIETYDKLNELLGTIKPILTYSDRIIATITNVAFADLCIMFQLMQSSGQDVRLYKENELLNNDFFVIAYRPVDNAVIYIESEKTQTYKPKINLINYN